MSRQEVSSIEQPVDQTHPGRPRSRSNFFAALGVAVALAAAFVGLTVAGLAVWKGSVGAAIAVLAGDELYVAPGHIQVVGSGSETKSIVFTNLSGRPIHVVGYNAACSCVKITQLPLDIAPHAKTTASVQASSLKSQNVPVIFLTDDPRQPQVDIVVDVRAVGS